MPVLFGASGDLTSRLLMPAVAQLAEAELLPQSFTIVGSAIRDCSSEEIRQHIAEALKETRSWRRPRATPPFGCSVSRQAGPRLIEARVRGDGLTDLFREVWLWDEWPDADGPDIGIDWVAERTDRSLVAAQVKCFDPSTRY